MKLDAKEKVDAAIIDQEAPPWLSWEKPGGEHCWRILFPVGDSQARSSGDCHGCTYGAAGTGNIDQAGELVFGLQHSMQAHARCTNYVHRFNKNLSYHPVTTSQY